MTILYERHYRGGSLSAQAGKGAGTFATRAQPGSDLAQRLVTDRAPTVMRSRDGTLIEVSEWKSREAIDAAHKNPSVLAMWEKFSAVCECVPLKTLPEADDMFAGFEPVVD